MSGVLLLGALIQTSTFFALSKSHVACYNQWMGKNFKTDEFVLLGGQTPKHNLIRLGLPYLIRERS